MNINNIIITKPFRESVPSKLKMEKCRRFYDMFHRQDRAIVLNSRNELVDGYIQYLVLVENGIAEVEIEYGHASNIPSESRRLSRTRLSMYVYGQHHPGGKEYVWRVPKKIEEDALRIQEGDQVCVRTRYGLRQIRVTHTEILDDPPIDAKIRCVKSI